MDTFNRCISGLFGIVLLAFAGLLIAAPDRLAALAGELRSAVQAAPALSLLWAGVALAALGVLLVLLAAWPKERRHFEAGVDGAVVEYPPSTVREAAERALLDLPAVRRARVEVGSRRDALDLRAQVDADPAADPQAIVADAAPRVREKLARGLGLHVERLRISVHPAHPSRWSLLRRHDPHGRVREHDYSSRI